MVWTVTTDAFSLTRMSQLACEPIRIEKLLTRKLSAAVAEGIVTFSLQKTCYQHAGFVADKSCFSV